MIVEAPIRPESKINLPTLTHFRYENSEREKIRGNITEFRSFAEDVRTATGPLRKLSEETENRVNAIDKTSEEIDNQLINIESPITIGRVYLKMLDDEQLKHATAEEIFDFFKLCLDINTSRFQLASLKESKDLQITALRGIAGIRDKKRNLSEFIQTAKKKNADKPARWFSGDQISWTHFLLEHAIFVSYLDPQSHSQFSSGSGDFKSVGITGTTYSDELPDWLFEAKADIPDREAVKQELAEDQEAKDVLGQQKQSMEKHREYIISRSNDRTKKAGERLRLKEASLPDIRSFPNLIAYLFVSKKSWRVFPDNTNVSPEETREIAIKAYVEKNAGAEGKEIISLFLEKRLIKEKVIENTGQIIDAGFVDLFMSIFDVDKLRIMKEENKKAYKFFNYELKPLLQALPQQDIDYIKEILETYKNNGNVPIEEFILDLGEIISSNFREMKSPVVKQINEFAGAFLRNNWEWLYQQIQKSLSFDKDIQPASPQGGPSSEIEAASVPILDAETHEIQTEIEKLQKGNLADWKLLYAPTKNVNDVVDIGGETLEERQEALMNFLRNNRIVSSIKPLSIVNALEWLVKVPQEIEQTRMGMIVNGEEFKKLKRGKVRIFYEMDTVKKTITFFLHQKQAMSYGF